MAGAKSYEEEARALDDVRECVFGFTKLAAVRCAVELGIPYVVENHPGCMTLAELSSALGCSSSSLHRIMRFLTHHGVFRQVKTDDQDSQVAYAQTPLSRLLMKDNMASMLLLGSNPEMIKSKLCLSKFLMSGNSDIGTFEMAHGMDIWQYGAANPCFSELFNKCMAGLARARVSILMENYTTAFQGIRSLVDVGGGDGSTLRTVVKACPWIIRAINFDLPHVVASSPNSDDRVQHVGGDMFVAIPSADAAFIASVLHDWDDDACVKILKNCKEAIPREQAK